MAIVPKFYFKDALIQIWINADRLYTAWSLISHIFWDDWIEKHEKGFEIYRWGKKSMEKLFNQHPIYSWLSWVTLAWSCYIVAIWEALGFFAKEKSIKEMITRLRDDENVNPAVFEIISAMSLREIWFKIEWLQVNNPEGNPVEIVASKNNKIFWIECKSMKLVKKIDDYHDRLYQILIEEYEQHKGAIKSRWWMAFLINLERPIADEIELKRLKWIIKWVMWKIVANVPDNELPLWIIYDTDTPIVFEYTWFLVNEKNHREIAQYFHENAIIHGGYSYAKKLYWSNDLPDLEDVLKADKKMHSMIGIAFPKDKTPKEKTPELFDKQLKKKITQQRSLIDAGENVILIFDAESICCTEEAKKIAIKYTKYDNLTILIAHTEKTPFKYNFETLLVGNSFT